MKKTKNNDRVAKKVLTFSSLLLLHPMRFVEAIHTCSIILFGGVTVETIFTSDTEALFTGTEEDEQQYFQ